MSAPNRYRVVHVNDPSRVGTLLVAALRERGHDVELVQPTVRAPHGTFLRARSLRQNQLYFLLDRIRVARDLRKSTQPLLLHLHYGMFGAIGLLAGHSFVLHFHGSDLIDDDRRLRYRTIHRWAASSAALRLVSTPDLLQYRDRFSKPLVFLPNPVPPPSAPPVVPGEGVLFAAKLDKNKGAATFLPAAVALAEAGLPVTVLGFGSAATDFSASLARIRATGGEVLSDRLSEESFSQTIAAARVVVGQFWTGALGMTELQAMQLGKPVVAYFCFPEAYGSPPALISAQCPSEIAREAQWLYADQSQASALGARGREWVEREHGSAAVASRLEQMYQSAGLIPSDFLFTAVSGAAESPA